MATHLFQTFTRACFLLLVLCDVFARLTVAQTAPVANGTCVGYENTLVRSCSGGCGGVDRHVCSQLFCFPYSGVT